MDRPPPRVSFVVPAWNEADEIGPTLRAIDAAAAGAGLVRHHGAGDEGGDRDGDGDGDGPGYECLVVDDGSTDATATLATEHGAEVVPVQLRQIAAVRNAGAAVARGSILIFVDADTRISAEAVRAALAALEAGVAGGGARVRFDRPVPIWASAILHAVMLVSRAGRMATGCFVFCSREAFDIAGGFDERYYATEELVFSRALRRAGRVVIVPAHVETSARKVQLFGLGRILLLMLRVGVRGPGAVRQRQGLEVWYGDGKAAAPRE
jgi:glycosyltransferase involved in cell wall biosynthesis